MGTVRSSVQIHIPRISRFTDSLVEEAHNFQAEDLHNSVAMEVLLHSKVVEVDNRVAGPDQEKMTLQHAVTVLRRSCSAPDS